MRSVAVLQLCLKPYLIQMTPPALTADATLPALNTQNSQNPSHLSNKIRYCDTCSSTPTHCRIISVLNATFAGCQSVSDKIVSNRKELQMLQDNLDEVDHVQHKVDHISNTEQGYSRRVKKELSHVQ